MPTAFIELTLTNREGKVHLNPSAIELFHRSKVYRDTGNYAEGSTVRTRSGVQYDVAETTDEILRLIAEAEKQR